LKLMNVRKYCRHTLIFTIGMNEMTDGCPAIKPWLKGPRWSMYKLIHINFVVKKDGKKISMGGITIGG